MAIPHFKVGGVPEHFNYPWYLAQQKGASAQQPFSFEWEAFPGGTGAMCEALDEGRIDLALLLTEGAIAYLNKGGDAQIVGTYVQSPLLWGVHVHAGSPFEQVADLEGQVFGISRYQSGSHLMAYVQAEQLGWDTEALRFEVVHDFERARRAMKEGRIQAFMWEKYTTKPTVDSGEWRRAGVLPTPWPCFVMVARREVAEQQQIGLLELMHGIRQLMAQTSESQAISFISEQFRLQPADVAEWYGQTTWLCAPVAERAELEKAQQALLGLGRIEVARPIADYCAPSCVFAEQELSEVMYNWRVESVYKKLGERGLAEGPLSMADLLDLGHLDQYHYLGADACYELAQALSLDEDDYVYDIGSGVGGTGRVLADCSGCQVLGVELQPELARLATELTRRAGLSDKVSFQAGDCLRYDWENTFDHFISLLVFLHVPDRTAVLEHCHKAIKPGGRFFIEDFVLLQPLTEKEQHHLVQTVSAVSLSSPSDYLQNLADAGFTDIAATDMTELWKDWTRKRYEAFRAAEAEERPFFGDELYERRLAFYEVIAELFAGGNLGGIRIVGTKGWTR